LNDEGGDEVAAMDGGNRVGEDEVKDVSAAAYNFVVNN